MSRYAQIPVGFVSDLALDGLDSREVTLFLGLILSNAATQSGLWEIDLDAIRRSAGNLFTNAEVRTMLASLQERGLLYFDQSLIYMPAAATTRSWASSQWRVQHTAAIYQAWGNTENRAFTEWALRNPRTEDVERLMASKASRRTKRDSQRPEASSVYNPAADPDADPFAGIDPEPQKNDDDTHQHPIDTHQYPMGTHQYPTNTQLIPTDRPHRRDRDRDRVRDRDSGGVGVRGRGDGPPIGDLRSSIDADPLYRPPADTGQGSHGEAGYRPPDTGYRPPDPLYRPPEDSAAAVGLPATG